MRIALAFLCAVLVGLTVIKNHRDEVTELASVSPNLGDIKLAYAYAKAAAKRTEDLNNERFPELESDLRDLHRVCGEGRRYFPAEKPKDPKSLETREQSMKPTIQLISEKEARHHVRKGRFVKSLTGRIELLKAELLKYLDHNYSWDFINQWTNLPNVGFSQPGRLRQNIAAFFDYMADLVEQKRFEDCQTTIEFVVGEVRDGTK